MTDQDQKNTNPDNSHWNSEQFFRMRRRRMWGSIVFIIIIILVFGFWDHHSHHYYGNGQDNLHTIAVSGHGEVFATSTIATFSFTASDQETTVSAAQDKMVAVANEAIGYLKQSGIAAADIQTTDYNINPTYAAVAPVMCSPGYGDCQNSTPSINGYQVSETVSVKLRDPSKAGTILGGLGKEGVSNISGLSFTIDKPDVLQEQAREMAINDAKAKAVKLAKDLGIKLNDIVSFDENGNPGPIPFAKNLSAFSAPAAAPTPDVEVGQNKITSDVTITYEIN